MSRVPTLVSETWGKAHKNSILRRRFPTRASLRQADWSHLKGVTAPNTGKTILRNNA